MNQRYIILLFILICSSSIFSQALVDSLHHFKIMMPSADYNRKQDTVQTALGELIFTNYYYARDEYQKDNPTNYFYSIGTCYYPAQAIHSDSMALVDPFFEQTLKDLQFNMKGELDYTSQTEIAGFPGQIFRMKYNEGQAVLKGLVYMVENQFFMIQVATSIGQSFNKEMDRFLESFQLVIKKKN